MAGCVGIVLVALLFMASPAAAIQPSFSFEKLPLFWHAANSSGAFNDTLINFVTNRRWSMATIEKFQAAAVAPDQQRAEDKIIAAAKQLKTKMPELPVVFYLNSVMDWTEYDLHAYLTQHPDLWLRSQSGDFAYINVPGSTSKIHVFDLANPTMQQVFLDVLRKAKASGYIDGCFLDRGNTNATRGTGGAHGWNLTAAKAAAWDRGHAFVLSEAGKIFSDGVVIGNNQDYSGVNARMFEMFGKHDLLADVEAVLAEDGSRFLEIHGEPVTTNHLDQACPDDVFQQTLAGFLVAAHNKSYYACTNGWNVQAGWDQWRVEYDFELGDPLGAAQRSSAPAGATTFKRSFASGTKVVLTVGPNNSHLLPCTCWGNGHITGPTGCASICQS
eukprot:m.110546 g.110546  ORF g.110546 m.110546 type:complete len:386 (-) comp16053_c0_seq2:194-1351(-)